MAGGLSGSGAGEPTDCFLLLLYLGRYIKGGFGNSVLAAMNE